MVSTSEEAENKALWRKLLFQGVFIVLAAAIAAGTFAFVSYLVEPDPFNPFGDYPVQNVVDAPILEVQLDGIAVDETSATAVLPVISLSEDSTVHVTGKKCLAEDQTQPVDVKGFFVWQAVEPPGFIHEAGRGQGTRTPGCLPIDFDNPIPDEVREYAEQQFADGHSVIVFNINGQETAIDSEGNDGAVQTWRTDNFALVP